MARQLKVRKRRRRSGGREGAGVKRRKATRDEETPEVEEEGEKERIKRQKGKGKAVDPPDKPDGPKKKSKKRVRIATPAPASSDGDGTDYAPSDGGASDEAEVVVRSNDGGEVENDDWTDLLGIPSAQTVRGRKYWRLLDQGIYRSALHDAARGEMDVGKALVQWEALRRRREEEEEVAEEKWRELQRERGDVGKGTKRKDTDADEEGDRSRSGTPAAGTKKKRGSESTPHDPYRSLRPFPLSRDPKIDDADDPRHRLEYDSDGAEVLPLPSSVALAKMARWPLHSSVLGSADVEPDSLKDVLAAEYERVYRRTRPGIPRIRERGPRSAYALDGPLTPSDPSAHADFDSSSDADSDPLDSDDDSPSPPSSLLALPSLLSQVLTRLADCVPKSPFPAYDYWSTRERDEEGTKDDAKRGVERERRAVGWEEVVEVVREIGIHERRVCGGWLAPARRWKLTAFGADAALSTSSLPTSSHSSVPPAVLPSPFLQSADTTWCRFQAGCGEMEGEGEKWYWSAQLAHRQQHAQSTHGDSDPLAFLSAKPYLDTVRDTMPAFAQSTTASSTASGSASTPKAPAAIPWSQPRRASLASTYSSGSSTGYEDEDRDAYGFSSEDDDEFLVTPPFPAVDSSSASSNASAKGKAKAIVDLSAPFGSISLAAVAEDDDADVWPQPVSSLPDVPSPARLPPPALPLVSHPAPKPATAVVAPDSHPHAQTRPRPQPSPPTQPSPEEAYRGRSRWPRLLWRSDIDVDSLRVLKNYHERAVGGPLPVLKGGMEQREVARWSRAMENAGL
ncbi:hypothetical protein Rt10032_c05g2350 [Rhodotorula toruloides]|uniref:Uncharacterized protein n=1 Tax=Rhodotorula toruloides TaxID=5286 RepID=A0A511KD80_RHOTO|nr:hypothetical protein Rt10032_c05g2350 [Rhodotorula toruloides]